VLHADIGLNCVYFAPRMMDSLNYMLGSCGPLAPISG